MTPLVSVHDPSALDPSRVRALSTLWASVWPNDEADASAFDQRYHRRTEERPDRRLHVIWAGDEALAVAETFAREVHPADGSGLTLMALAGVCSAPHRRGEKLGWTVTASAFARVDAGEFPVALFQTPVPGFYERLGARLVSNPFVDRTAPERPAANPFWDPHVMIYPANAPWPEGEIDLNGPAY